MFCLIVATVAVSFVTTWSLLLSLRDKLDSRIAISSLNSRFSLARDWVGDGVCRANGNQRAITVEELRADFCHLHNPRKKSSARYALYAEHSQTPRKRHRIKYVGMLRNLTSNECPVNSDAPSDNPEKQWRNKRVYFSGAHVS